MKVTVLGIGNILLRDEGVGVHAVERLQQRFCLPEYVQVVDGGTAGMELIDYLSGADLLVIVDAVHMGRAPGSLVRLAGEELPAFFRTRISPHQLGLAELLATLRVLGEEPKQSVLIGVEPLRLDTGLEMSREVADKVDVLVGMIMDELAAAGIAFEPRPAPSDTLSGARAATHTCV